MMSQAEPGQATDISGRRGVFGRLDARRLTRIRSCNDARRAASRLLPRLLFEYIDGGAEDELTLSRNTADIHDVQIRPRMGVWVPNPELSTKVLGSALEFPVLTAPCGGMRLVHPDGDIGVARGAANAGTVHVAPSASGFTMEEIREAAPRSWFQLYRFFRRETMEHLVQRARATGYEVMLVTVDTQVGGNREKDYRNGFTVQMQVNTKNAVKVGPQLAVRPLWSLRYLLDGMPFELENTRAISAAGDPIRLSDMTREGKETHSPSWEEIAWIRDNWPGKLVVKGVLSAGDARKAVSTGADGVVVSNHGGRQLDGAPSAISVLPEVAAEIGNEATVLLDSGIRRGTDVVKALALGADAVLVGRMPTWGLAVGGACGVTHMLNILRSDMRRTLQLMGCRSIHELDEQWVNAPRTAGRPPAAEEM